MVLIISARLQSGKRKVAPGAATRRALAAASLRATLPPANMASPQMAIVFARLDPILKSLLEGLTSLKSLLPSISLENCEKEFVDHEQSGSTDKIFVTLVQKIAKELESLTRGMRLTSDSSQPENVQPHQRLQHANTPLAIALGCSSFTLLCCFCFSR